MIAVNFGHRNFFSELAQFVATLRRHRHVQLRAAGWVTHLVVLESGEQRIFSVEDARARRNVLRDLIDRIRLVCLPWRKVRLGIDHQLRKIRLVERFDARRERCVAQNENRRAVFSRDPCGFDRNIETIFHARGREHDSRAVAVTAEDRLMQIALLDVRRQTCAWARRAECCR